MQVGMQDANCKMQDAGRRSSREAFNFPLALFERERDGGEGCVNGHSRFQILDCRLQNGGEGDRRTACWR